MKVLQFPTPKASNFEIDHGAINPVDQSVYLNLLTKILIYWNDFLFEKLL